MIKAFLAILISLVFIPSYAQDVQELLDEYNISKKQFEYYSQQNYNLSKLDSYKDDETALAVKLIMLDYINKSRAKYNLSQLELDLFSSRVANKAALESTSEDFWGHLSSNGYKPYHRYGTEGGIHHVSENTATRKFMYEGPGPHPPFKFGIRDIISTMQSQHDAMRDEVPPHDGHRKNILDSNHTKVGIGYAANEKTGRINYYEEFLNMYFVEENVTIELINDNILIELPMEVDNLYTYSINITLDNPKPISKKDRTSPGSYEDYGKEVEYIPHYNFIENEGKLLYRVELSKKGLYYVKVFLTKNKKDLERNTSTTEGKIPALGVVLHYE